MQLKIVTAFNQLKGRYEMAATKGIAIAMKNDKRNNEIYIFMDEFDNLYNFDKWNLANNIIRNSLIIYNLDIRYDQDLHSTREKAQSAQFGNKEINIRALNSIQGDTSMLKVSTQYALVAYAQQHKEKVAEYIKKNYERIYRQDVKDMYAIIGQNFPIAYTERHLDTVVKDLFMDAIIQVIGWNRKNNKNKPNTNVFFR